MSFYTVSYAECNLHINCTNVGEFIQCEISTMHSFQQVDNIMIDW